MFFLFLLIVVFIIFLFSRDHKQAWLRLAKQLSLTMKSDFFLEGDYKGLPWTLSLYEQGKSKFSTLSITNPPNWPKALVVHSKNKLFLKFKQIHGIPQKTVSDEFNKKYVLYNGVLPKKLLVKICNLPLHLYLYMGSDKIEVIYFTKSPPTQNTLEQTVTTFWEILGYFSRDKLTEVTPSSKSTKKSLRSQIKNTVQIEEPKRDLPKMEVDTFLNLDAYALELPISADEANTIEEVISNEIEKVIPKLPHISLDQHHNGATAETEQNLKEIYQKLRSFEGTSTSRNTIIAQWSFDTLNIQVQEIFPTFEICIEDEYRKGCTIKGVCGDVPLLLYTKKGSQSDLKKGEKRNLSVRIKGWDFLQRKIVLFVD